MPIIALALLPFATIATAGIAIVALIRGNNDLAATASLHMTAYALAQIALWFVL